MRRRPDEWRVDCSDCSTNVDSNINASSNSYADAGAADNAHYGNKPATSSNATTARHDEMTDSDPPLQDDTDGEAFDELTSSRPATSPSPSTSKYHPASLGRQIHNSCASA